MWEADEGGETSFPRELLAGALQINIHIFGGSQARCGAPCINYGNSGSDGNSARVDFLAKIVIMAVIIPIEEI